MWRWSCFSWIWHIILGVFSTYVEVILYCQLSSFGPFCILHVCGGDPLSASWSSCRVWYSPRMWRWSSFSFLGPRGVKVFSTYVEVIPILRKQSNTSICILHVCGGDPILQAPTAYQYLYSPRMWRWSQCIFCLCYIAIVFSTYVEVIPIWSACWASRIGILHVCGGDPNVPVTNVVSHWYSPRMWRWSSFFCFFKYSFAVFSTYVEVILLLLFF